MKLPNASGDAAYDHLLAMIGIGGLVMFGIIMLFLGWLKFKDRNTPPGMKAGKRTKTRTKRK